MEGVRRAGKEDEAKVYEMICELEETKINQREFSKVYQTNLTNPEIFYFVYEQEGKLIGFLSLHVQRLLHHAAGIAEIQEFFIVEVARRCGIGRKLFQQAKEVSILQGCVQLEVCCNQKRTKSHEFYESMGMTNHHYKFCISL